MKAFSIRLMGFALSTLYVEYVSEISGCVWLVPGTHPEDPITR